MNDEVATDLKEVLAVAGPEETRASPAHRLAMLRVRALPALDVANRRLANGMTA